MNALIRAGLLTGTIAIFAGASISAAWSQSKTPSLFKVVTEKDEIIIGLNAQELHAIGGSEKKALFTFAVAVHAKAAKRQRCALTRSPSRSNMRRQPR